MENFFKITSAQELSKIFELAQEKLVILMFFSKHNPDCKRAYSFFEKSATNHNLSLFCVIDMDKFQGESRYVANVNTMPKFECYHLGNSLGSCITSNEKDIENLVRTGEQYIMTQTNMRNNGTGQNAMLGQIPINPMQIQQQILNNAQMQNPMYFQQLMQNPILLQNLVQRQMQQMVAPQMSMPQQMIQPQVPQITQPQITQPQVPQITQMPIMPMATQTTIPNNTSNFMVPTMQQMQQMFQIFQMMQQMGILNTQPQTVDNNIQPENNQKTVNDDTIVLPNGDKIIPLGNGKFGLIKKNN